MSVVSGNSGPAGVLIGVTNNTHFSQLVVVGPTKVFPFGDRYTTNFMGGTLQLRLPPQSGQQVLIAPATDYGPPWLFGMTYERCMSAAELRLRSLAVSLRLVAQTNMFSGYGFAPIALTRIER
jgi:hypothetical protein